MSHCSGRASARIKAWLMALQGLNSDLSLFVSTTDSSMSASTTQEGTASLSPAPCMLAAGHRLALSGRRQHVCQVSVVRPACACCPHLTLTLTTTARLAGGSLSFGALMSFG